MVEFAEDSLRPQQMGNVSHVLGHISSFSWFFTRWSSRVKDLLIKPLFSFEYVLFSPVGFKGNESILEITFFPADLSTRKVAFCLD